MRNPVVLAIKDFVQFDEKLDELIRMGVVGCRNFNGYYFLKMRPNRPSLYSDDVSIQLPSGMKIQYQAEVIFDTKSNGFTKNRFNGDNTTQWFPPALERVYSPILDIQKGMCFDGLIEKYSRTNLAEAIYLTDSYSKFREEIDMIDYQLIRYKYGKEVPMDFIPELVERYPERLL